MSKLLKKQSFDKVKDKQLNIVVWLLKKRKLDEQKIILSPPPRFGAGYQ
ncbi:hypothetical protein LJC73_00995 [Bacteroidales bacterium OttesenSCG-928-L14]|nr:hypothetical protein [Bacteroidales bacterium OttesenSCG-928-L14]